MAETFLIKKTTFNDNSNDLPQNELDSFIIGPGELNGPGGSARDSDLNLYGYGSLKWGEGLNDNLFKLLENNACPAKELGDYNPATTNNDYDPVNDPILPKDENDLGTANGITVAVIGQPWFNTTNNRLYSYGSSGWKTIFNDDGSLTMEGTLDMNNFEIINLANPVGSPLNPNNAINLGFADNRYINVTGDSMTGVLSMNADIDMNNFEILNLAVPTSSPLNPNSVINLGFADSRYVNVTGDTMTGILDMGTNRINNVVDPVDDQDAATKKYVNDISSIPESYDIAAFILGEPTTTENVLIFVVPRPLLIDTSHSKYVPSLAKANVASTIAVNMSITVNGNPVGDVDFVANNDTGLVSWSNSPFTLSAGDIIEISALNTTPTGMVDMMITLAFLEL